MLQKLGYVLGGAALGWMASVSVGSLQAKEAVEPEELQQAEDAVTPPTYLVVGSRYIDPDGLGPYRKAATPLARRAGLEILARDEVSNDDVLEGAWPYEGSLTIERFESRAALEAFWFSKEYQAAIPLREGKVAIDFIVALDGVR